MKTIGFIGLGAMGNPMAKNFVKNGYNVLVYDVSENAVEALAKEGAKRCDTVAELAESSEVIFASLPNGKIVESIMTGEAGVIASAKKGSCIVDLSSVAPETSVRMYELAKKKEIAYLDAPVSGGVAGAGAGTLTIMVGGDREAFEKISTELYCIGKNVFYIGKTGNGDAMKIVNNLMLGCNMAALAEALTLGEKCGLDLETMNRIVSISSGRSYAQEAKMEKFIMPGTFEGGFAVALQHKDLTLALETAKKEKMPLPMTAAASQVYGLAEAMEYGRQDISVVTKMWEDLILAKSE